MKSSTVKHTLAILAVSSVALISFVLIRKSKNSKKRDLINESYAAEPTAQLPQSLVLIGDSQTARTLGNAYQNEFEGVDVRFFGKPGAMHSDYLKDSTLKSELKKLGCAEIIVIQLGDNGVSASKNEVLDFVALVKENCPNAKHIFWGGPMKAVKPTNSNSTYVNTTDPSNPRYLDRYNQTRILWDQRLKDWLSGTDVIYFSNYFAQEAQPLSNAFSDARGGDGIHLEPNAAAEQAKLLKAFILEKLSQ